MHTVPMPAATASRRRSARSTCMPDVAPGSGSPPLSSGDVITELSRIPHEGDVHLRVWLAGVSLDFATTAAAARNFIRECSHRRWCTVGLVRSTVEYRSLLPRLPCERLFLAS